MLAHNEFGRPAVIVAMKARSETKARILTFASRLAAIWAFGYGLYRWYYAASGTVGMLGTPVSMEQFVRINAVAGALLFVFAVLSE